MAGSCAQHIVKLPSGGLMPMIGFGTWRIREGIEDIVTRAVQAGYRHIDTAYMYKNESGIGKALSRLFEDGTVKREELFVVTKLPSHAHRREKVPEVLRGCLQRLGLDYVDLFLIHSPMSTLEVGNGEPVYPADKQADLVDTWKGMEDAYNQGLTKSIGLSNFNRDQITRILQECTVKPENLQVECHAYFQQRELQNFCKENNISFTAYSPLGRPGLINKDGEQEPVLIEDKEVKAVGEKHGKSAAQVLLRFLLQLGMVVIPKSSNEGRMKDNIQVCDFNLDDDDMAALKKLERGLRYVRFNAVPGQTDHPQYPFKAPF